MMTQVIEKKPPFALQSEKGFSTADYGQEFSLFAPHCLDSYKLSHRAQYTPGTEYIMSNFTPRSNHHLQIPKEYNDNKVVWFGIQGTLKELAGLWDRTFFSQPKQALLDRYAARVAAFSSDDKPVHTGHLSELHDLGYLPIRVKSIQEGSLVNIGIPTFTIVNTDPRFYWLTNALETYLSNESWKAPTVATIARAYRRILEDFAGQTGSPLDFVDWQGHCFADRGMSGMIDAAKSGAAHSTSFYGTDSVSAFDYLDYAYFGQETFLGGSVNATEHSVMCLDGQDNELETIKRIISTVHDTGVVSFVADSWDFWKVIDEYMPALKDTILARKRNSIGLSKTVVRPDSGDPVDIICGTVPTIKSLEFNREVLTLFADKFNAKDLSAVYVQCQGKYYEALLNDSSFKEISPTSEMKGAIECLYETFGGTVNEKGYKVLMDRVGLIYGDSITPARALEICCRLEAKGFASCNFVLGIGSYTYQYITRDTLGIALKATYGVVSGVGQEMVKNPKTDTGVKKSAKGLVKVVRDDKGDYHLEEGVTWEREAEGELKLVFENGQFYNRTTIAEIRSRIRA